MADREDEGMAYLEESVNVTAKRVDVTLHGKERVHLVVPIGARVQVPAMHT